MQLSTMRASLRKRIGNPSTADVPDADLTEIINQSYKEVALKFRFHKTRRICRFSTVAGTANYELPADIGWIKRVRDNTNKVKIDPRDDAFIAARTDPSVTSKPTGYKRYRGFVLLDPTPDGIYEIEIFYQVGDLTVLSANGDSPVTPLAWDEGIILLSRYHYYSDFKGDIPKAQFSYTMYTTWVSDQPNEVDEEEKEIQGGVRIPSLGGWGTAEDRRLDFNHSD
jgi:hypothetical protein